MSDVDINIRTNRRLAIWYDCLRFEIVSADGPSVKCIGRIDMGSTECLVSSSVVRQLGLKRLPLSPDKQPILEGIEDVLACQPIGFVMISVQQSDLDLDTQPLPFLVVQSHKIDLLVGRDFAFNYDIDAKIRCAVEASVDPQDWDKDRAPSHHVHMLVDGRTESKHILPSKHHNIGC